MRNLISILLALVLSFTPAQTTANPDLTATVNATWLVRTVDGDLMSLAQLRADYQVAFSGGLCAPGSMTHEGWTTAEVLACNFFDIQNAIDQWIGSPAHHAILSDAAYTNIGCATAVGVLGSTFYVCVLTSPGGEFEPPITVPNPDPQPMVENVVTLPNTAVDTSP